MRTIKIYCKTCGISLTEPLVELNEKDLRLEDATNALQSGLFSIMTEDDKKQLVISLDEGYIFNHPDHNRFQGCCGSSGADGLNKLCSNGHEVATEFSDCYMPHYIAFDTDKIMIKEKISDYDYRKIMI